MQSWGDQRWLLVHLGTSNGGKPLPPVGFERQGQELRCQSPVEEKLWAGAHHRGRGCCQGHGSEMESVKKHPVSLPIQFPAGVSLAPPNRKPKGEGSGVIQSSPRGPSPQSAEQSTDVTDLRATGDQHPVHDHEGGSSFPITFW